MAMPLSSEVYDSLFVKACNTHLDPKFDWRWLKAQCYRESVFNPQAVSPAGAQGLMQFMPGTWQEVQQSGLPLGSPFDPEDSINAGAYYMNKMIKGWKSYRPELDRLALAFASYNAGFGNMIAAQKHEGGLFLYSQIIVGLPFITGPKNSHETITYVKKIFEYYSRIVLGG